MVRMGSAAFLRVCFATTTTSPSPFARAVRTKSARWTSSTAERVMRAIEAMANAPRVNAGSTRCRQSPLPEVGNRSSQRENTRMKRMPRKNVGADWPISASAIAAWSSGEFRRTAEKTPTGSATTTAIRNAATPNSRVAGR